MFHQKKKLIIKETRNICLNKKKKKNEIEL